VDNKSPTVLLKNDGLSNHETERDVGKPDATRPGMTQNGATVQRGRASLIALWLTQVVLALMFLMAGGSKLAGTPDMVRLFDAVGLGQWLRYVTGTIEVTSGIALLVPSAAPFGALLLIPTMLGASLTNVFIVHTSPAMPRR
jgi:uncharacterized membrane protein YphA (DoxX/SURF4 family)